MRNPSTLDALAGSLAARHHGLLTRADALRMGFSVDQIRHRVATGRWQRAGQAVYQITGAPTTDVQRVLGACWAGPAGAVASHASAAHLFGLSAAPGVPHLTVPRTASSRTPSAVVHRADLRGRDRTQVGVVPSTGVARTLIDCATISQPELLADLVDDALVRQLTTVRRVRAAMARASHRPGRKGLAALDSILRVWTDGITPDSPAEMRLVRRLSEWGFPPPVHQHKVYAPSGRLLGRIDFAWPEWRTGLEYDGQRYHTPRRLAYDEKRHARIVSSGWRLHRCDRFDLLASADRLRCDLEPVLFGRRAS